MSVAECLHGSAVAFELCDGWAGVLICGRSGAGKSGLALELIGQGARLVADDQTELRRDGDCIRLSAPAALRGRIELRGLGLLRVAPVTGVPLALVIDLDSAESARLPMRHYTELMGLRLPLLKSCPGRAFAIGVACYVLARQWQDEDPSDVPL